MAHTTFRLDGYESGTVLIDGLTVTLSTPSADPPDVESVSYVIRVLGTYDQLIVRNSTFHISEFSSGSVFFSNNIVTGSGALVENTTFNGGDFGVAVFEAGPRARGLFSTTVAGNKTVSARVIPVIVRRSGDHADTERERQVGG